MTSSKALATLSETEPERVYPRFAEIAALLRSPNQIVQWNAARALASLARVDSQGRLEHILPLYLHPLTGSKLITACNVVGAAPAIARAKPHLADRIASRILRVESATFPTPECMHVARGHAVRALDEMYPYLKRRKPVLAFVRRQLDNPRNSTRKAAAAFLKRHAVK